MATGKRRGIVKEDLNLGNGPTSIQTDSGGVRTATMVGIQTFLGTSYVAATDFPAADAGESINAALLSLPAAGGTVDARGFVGNQVFSTNPFVNVTVPFTLILGNATFSVLVPMQLTALNNCHIVGASESGRVANGTIFRWDGLAGSSMMIWDRVQGSSLNCCSFIAGNTTPAVGWQLDQLIPAASGFASATDIGRSLNFLNITTGIQLGNTATTNNGDHSFYDVWIQNATNGYWFNNAASNSTRIICGAVEDSTYGIFQNDGGFTVEGTRFAGSLTSDIFLTTGTSAICLDSVSSVFSPRFIGTNTSVPSGTIGFTVTVVGCTVSSLQIPTGGAAIDFGFVGALNLIGNNFAANANGGGTGSHIVGVYTVHAEAANAIVNSIGNTYPNFAPFIGSMKRVSIGDSYTDFSNLAQPLGTSLTVTNGTVSLNGQTYNWPNTQVAGVLTTDGAGNLTWSPGAGGGGGTITGSGSTNNVTKWTSSSAIGNSSIIDNAGLVTLSGLPTITHNAPLFVSSAKQVMTDEGNFNWDAVNKNLYVGFGPMTDYVFGLAGGVFTTGAGGVVIATANSNASTGELHVVASSYFTIGAQKTGSGTYLPITLVTGGHETVRLTTDPFLQLSTSYTGGNLSAAGTVALRNNAGTLESSQNGGAWAALVGGSGGGVSGSGTTGLIPKWTNGAGAVLGNSSIADDGSNVTVGDLPSITHNAPIFANSSKQLKTDEGNLNWDSTNKNLNIGFGPMTDYSFGLSGGIFTTGAGGLVAATANSNSSTLELHVVAGNYATIGADKTGTGTRLPIVMLTGGNETLRLTTDPFVQITTSYTGTNKSASGAVALRNNAGVLEASQNAGAWTAIGTGNITGAGVAGKFPVYTTGSNLTWSLMGDAGSGVISGANSFAMGPGTLPAFTVFYGSSDTGSIYMMSYASSDAGSAASSFRKSRGTHSSPTDVLDGDTIGSILSNAYSSGFLGTAKIVFRVSGLGSSGQRPGSKIEFSTNLANGTQTIGMVIQNNQVVTMPAYGAGTATFDAAGNLSSVSDEKLKDIQGSFNAGLQEVLKLMPIRYRWNSESGLETEHVYAGFSAQNVKESIPLAVGEDANGHLTLQDRALLAAHTNAFKEVNERLERLEKMMTSLLKH